MFNYQNDFVKLVEVGPRDGLQNEKTNISLEDKYQYIDLLSQSGLKNIEATSFVRSDKIPQMANATELFRLLAGRDDFNDFNFPCLVPNLVGYDMAMNVGVKEISLFSATSSAFTQKNINCTVDESFNRMKLVSEKAKKDKVKIRGYISTAFGCPYQGVMSSKKLTNTIEQFLEIGVYEISIGDTIGVATPKQVLNYINDFKTIVSMDKIAMHFHDTKGMALANIISALEVGVRVFDASSGGLGGCPYAKGSTGNVATEDVVYLLNSLGLKTGIDEEKLLAASKFILDKVGKTSPSKYVQTLLKREK
jgi:hydroxymethylglutaryl-CoA lyase